MSLRRSLTTALALGACAVAMLVASGTASAATVLHGSDVETVSGSFYNICDLSQGPDSPTFSATGRFQQQLTLVQVSDLHFVLTAHETMHMVGSYPDGRNVVVHSTFNLSEAVNVDPSSLDTGDLVLDSALVTTSTQHDLIQVTGKNGAPDENYAGTVHLTFTPNLQIASMVVDYRGGC